MHEISEKLYNLQVLRAFACLVVALGHITIPLPILNESPDGIFGHGPCGVDVFFVISGFIMVYTTRSGNISPWSFAHHRLARIVPLYWLTTFTIFGACSIAPSLFPNTDKSTAHLIASLLFLPAESSPTNPVGWTLNYEMFFYALFMLGMFYNRGALRVAIPCTAIVILAIFGLVSAGTFPVAFLTRPIALEFVFGIAVAFVVVRAPTLNSYIYLTATAAAIIIMFACPYPLEGYPDYYRVLVWGIPATVLVYSAISLERIGIVLRYAPIILVGEASYAIYLTHYPIAQLLKKFPLPLGSTFVAVIMIVATMCTIIAVGVIAYFLLDKPLSRFFRAFPRRTQAETKHNSRLERDGDRLAS